MLSVETFFCGLHHRYNHLEQSIAQYRCGNADLHRDLGITTVK